MLQRQPKLLLMETSGISPDMALRLASAFGTSPELWAGMQMQYDLYQASKAKRPCIHRFVSAFPA